MLGSGLYGHEEGLQKQVAGDEQQHGEGEHEAHLAAFWEGAAGGGDADYEEGDGEVGALEDFGAEGLWRGLGWVNARGRQRGHGCAFDCFGIVFVAGLCWGLGGSRGRR